MKRIRNIGIVGLTTLMIALSLWASSYYKSKVIGSKGGKFSVNESAKLRIPAGAISTLTEVTVSIEEDDSTHKFVLIILPDMILTNPALLRLSANRYPINDYLLLDEDGEAMDFRYENNGTQVEFKIYHFSRYHYHEYD